MPFWLAKLIKTLVKKPLRSWQKHVDQRIPRNSLSDAQVKDAAILSDRTKLLEQLPKNAIVAELGVDKGDFTQLILEKCNPKKLHLVDSWSSKRYNEDKKNSVIKRFESASDVVDVHIGLSTTVADQFDEHYFDWIYIDTDHSYQTTKDELELYRTKVKEGGIIAGHDFSGGNWLKLNRYGVIEAVYEFCHKYNWGLLYITSELSNDKEMPSFAIRQL